MEILETLSNIGIIPVIAIDDADKAIALCDALKEGGLPAAEITFRTAAGQEAIRRVAKERPEILVGAGTVLTVKQAEAAIEAGAKFIVSPGYFDDVVNYCIGKNMPVLPGCATPSDMTKAVNAGLKTVKFFPAEQSGGVDYLKSVASVFPLTFMPTGGVKTENMMDYLNFEKIACCGGTWMVKKDLINGEKWAEITKICKDAVKKMLGFYVKHIGINTENQEAALAAAKLFGAIFDFDVTEHTPSYFAGTGLEIMKYQGRGTMGHIAIGTNNVERAYFHLKRNGVVFDEETKQYDDKGKLKFIYIKDEIAGFAVHLVK